MKRKLLLFFVLFLMIVPLDLLAQPKSGEDDLTVVTIRKKYFLKKNRHEIGANVAYIPNDTFVNSVMLGGSYGYHWKENFFFEIPAGVFLNFDSTSSDQLKEDFGVAPDTDDFNWYAEGHLGWSPIYAKLNFMGKKIIYFDISGYAGGGIIDADISDISPLIVFGMAQRFVFNKWMVLRLDIKDQVIIRDGSNVNGSLRNAIYIMLGMNFFFPMR